MDPISRTVESFTYSQSDGRLSYKLNGTQIGVGTSGVKNDASDICSTLGLTHPIIPVGVYTVSKIQCYIGAYNFTRVLKLEPSVRYLTNQKYDFLYTDLYIYPDATEVEDIKSIENIKGISFSENIRKLITVGDIIEVENRADYDTLISCSIVPPPKVGEIDVNLNDQTNEIIAYFKNWDGSEEMNDRCIYRGCIELIENYCSYICDESIVQVDGIRCNIGNSINIGNYGTEGTYPIRFMAKYGEASLLALQSEFIKVATFNKISDDDIQLSSIQGVANVTSYEMLIQLNKKFIIPISKFISQLNLSNKRTLSTECACGDKGSCKTINKIAVCECQEGFYGRKCELTNEVYTAFKSFAETVSYSIENMIQNNVKLSLDSIFESFAIVTICPAASLSNDVINSILSSILIGIERNDLDELDIEHLNTIISNVMKMVEESTLYNSVQKASDSFKYIPKISKIESIYSHLLSKKVKYSYFIGAKEAIKLGSQIFNYQINIDQATLSSNITYTLNQIIDYSVSVEYPYEIAKIFPTPIGYVVGSNALGFLPYSNSNIDTNAQIEITFASNIINATDLLIRRWDVGCGCYDPMSSKFDTTVCKKVEISSSVFLCSCSLNYSPCYLVYKFSLSLILVIAVSLVVVVASVVVGVVAWKIVKRRRNRITKIMISSEKTVTHIK